MIQSITDLDRLMSRLDSVKEFLSKGLPEVPTSYRLPGWELGKQFDRLTKAWSKVGPSLSAPGAPEPQDAIDAIVEGLVRGKEDV